MLYRDTENGATIQEIDLLAEYIENAEQIKEDSGAACFIEWLNNCLENGFLEEVVNNGL